MIAVGVSLSTPVGRPALIHYCDLKKTIDPEKNPICGLQGEISEGGVKLIAYTCRCAVPSMWVVLCYMYVSYQ